MRDGELAVGERIAMSLMALALGTLCSRHSCMQHARTVTTMFDRELADAPGAQLSWMDSRRSMASRFFGGIMLPHVLNGSSACGATGANENTSPPLGSLELIRLNCE